MDDDDGVLRIWGGNDLGTVVIEIDVHLAPGEVDIDLAELDVSTPRTITPRIDRRLRDYLVEKIKDPQCGPADWAPPRR